MKTFKRITMLFVLLNLLASCTNKEICGNYTGNVINNSWTAFDDNWIYYSNPSDEERLYKMKKDNTSNTMLDEGLCVTAVNVLDDWVYYSAGTNEYQDRKFYKIKTDGTGKTKLFDGDPKYVNIIDDWIYYIKATPETNEMYKINTNGKNHKKVSE